MLYEVITLDPQRPIPVEAVAWNHSDPQTRFAVYRNNVTQALAEALAATFPVTQALVGAAFFHALAVEFARCEPPRITSYNVCYTKLLRLAIVTLGFGEIIRILLNNWTSVTGGPNGISGIEKPTLFGLEFSRRASAGGQTFHEFIGIDYNSSYRVIFLYLIAVLLVTIVVYLINRLMRMPVGRAWEALREDEIACRSLGRNNFV